MRFIYEFFLFCISISRIYTTMLNGFQLQRLYGIDLFYDDHNEFVLMLV
jgi:hypothetical protein